MMLPGVELARRRRIHHHGGGGCREALVSSRGYGHAGGLSQLAEQRGAAPSSMGEPALLARRRLEEKLRGFGLGTAVVHLPTFSYRNPTVGEGDPGGPVRRAEMAAAIGTAASDAASATRGARKKKPALPVASGRPALERVPSASADRCAVCLDVFQEEGGRQELNLPCSHRYHSDCVLPWLAAHPHCPCCRTPVPYS